MKMNTPDNNSQEGVSVEISTDSATNEGGKSIENDANDSKRPLEELPKDGSCPSPKRQRTENGGDGPVVSDAENAESSPVVNNLEEQTTENVANGEASTNNQNNAGIQPASDAVGENGNSEEPMDIVTNGESRSASPNNDENETGHDISAARDQHASDAGENVDSKEPMKIVVNEEKSNDSQNDTENETGDDLAAALDQPFSDAIEKNANAQTINAATNGKESSGSKMPAENEPENDRPAALDAPLPNAVGENADAEETKGVEKEQKGSGSPDKAENETGGNDTAALDAPTPGSTEKSGNAKEVVDSVDNEEKSSDGQIEMDAGEASDEAASLHQPTAGDVGASAGSEEAMKIVVNGEKRDDGQNMKEKEISNDEAAPVDPSTPDDTGDSGDANEAAEITNTEGKNKNDTKDAKLNGERTTLEQPTSNIDHDENTVKEPDSDNNKDENNGASVADPPKANATGENDKAEEAAEIVVDEKKSSNVQVIGSNSEENAEGDLPDKTEDGAGTVETETKTHNGKQIGSNGEDKEAKAGIADGPAPDVGMESNNAEDNMEIVTEDQKNNDSQNNSEKKQKDNEGDILHRPVSSKVEKNETGEEPMEIDAHEENSGNNRNDNQNGRESNEAATNDRPVFDATAEEAGGGNGAEPMEMDANEKQGSENMIDSQNGKQNNNDTATLDRPASDAIVEKVNAKENMEVVADEDNTQNTMENGGADGEAATLDQPESSSVIGENGNQAPLENGQGSKGGLEKAQKDSVSEEKKPCDEAPKKHIRSKKIDPKVLEIRRRIQAGSRDNDLLSAIEAYEEAVKNGIRLEAQSFYSLLNLCDGSERSPHIGTPKTTNNNNKLAGGSNTKEDVLPPRSPSPQREEVDVRVRQKFAFRIKDHMSELNLALNEASFTALIRIVCLTKEYAKAEELLDDAEKVQQCRPKLRLYSSLLSAYCDDKRMEDALKCWKRLSQRGMEVTEKETLSLMRCACATGDANVMQAVLTDVADDVAVPSKDTVAAILQWFASPHATHEECIAPIHADDSRVQKLLEEIHSASGATEPAKSMGPVVDTKGWTISSAVEIETSTGALHSGCLKDLKLKPVPLADSAWKEMAAMNESIVVEGQISGNNSEFAGGKKGKKRMDFSPEKRREEWKKFNAFLNGLDSPFDVLIDGANVGYFKQNFGSAPKHVDYNQIDWVVQHFTRMGKRVLLVLHERHFAHFLMPNKFKPMQRKWEEQGVLYKTPAGMNDDWFWLHAALKFKSLVLTNDEMRDHHFQMLSPRIFLRWKERHQIHFEFGDWEHQKRKVELVYPPIYSRRIQRVEDGLVVPLAKRGDENRFLDGIHVAADDEPRQDTYLCIRPKKESRDAVDPKN